MSTPIAFALALGLASFATLPVEAQDWSGFRGHNGSAASSAQGLPTSFGPEQNLRWRVEVPFGRSSPILTEKAVVVTGSDEEYLYVMAIDRDSGEELWTQALERARTDTIFPANDSASPTPVTDGRNVYAFFAELGLVSFDAEGDERWRLPLGPFASHYGMSSSPILAAGAVLQLCDQQRGSYLLAVEATTGELRWKVDRSAVAEGWTTPLVHPAEAPRQVIVAGSYQVHGYGLESGAELWSLKGFAYDPTPSPTLAGDRLYVCSFDHSTFPMPPFEGLLAAYDKDADGRVSEDELRGSLLQPHFGWLDGDMDGVVVGEEYARIRAGMASKDYGMVAIDLAGSEGPVELWRYKKGLPWVSSPLLYEGVLYLVKGSGLVTMLDARSGDVLQRERLPGGGGASFSSPVAADGKVYVTDNAGRIAVLEAGPGWKVLGSNELGEECHATPAIGGDSIFVRTSEALYRFGKEP